MQSHLLPHVVSGIETSSSQKNIPALFFLPGFPDEKESFDLIASKYRNSHKIIQCCFPGFDVKTKSLGGGQLPRKWGYDFDLLIEMTKNTIQENTCEGQEVYVVSHDWGAALTYMLIEKYPTLIKALVACDVGVSHPNELTLKMVAILITYQLYLGIAFIMSQLCSQLIADLMVYFFPWKFIGPAPYETKMPRHPREMHSWMCYPYFYMTIGRLWHHVPDMNSPLRYGVPLLYLYGPKKRIMFHTKKFLTKIDQMKNDTNSILSVSRWVCVENVGHWLHVEKVDQLENEMNQFFKDIQKIETKTKK